MTRGEVPSSLARNGHVGGGRGITHRSLPGRGRRPKGIGETHEEESNPSRSFGDICHDGGSAADGTTSSRGLRIKLLRGELCGRRARIAHRITLCPFPAARGDFVLTKTARSVWINGW